MRQLSGAAGRGSGPGGMGMVRVLGGEAEDVGAVAGVQREGDAREGVPPASLPEERWKPTSCG